MKKFLTFHKITGVKVKTESLAPSILFSEG